MIRHALTLEHCARELNALVAGTVLVDAWSQEKLTCVLRFLSVSGESVDIKCTVNTDFGSVLNTGASHRARKNSIDVFTELFGQTCSAVLKADGDRVITFLMTNARLHVLLYSGNNGNVIVENNGQINDALHDKKSLVDTQFTISNHPIKPGAYLSLLNMPDADILAFVRASRTFYTLSKDDEYIFSPIPLPGWDVEHETDNIFAALQRAISSKRHSSFLLSNRKTAVKRLEASVKKYSRSLENMASDSAVEDRVSNLRLLGDVLMSDPHPTLDGRDHLDTQDFQGASLTIKLDPKKTTIENAQEFYNKARRSERSAAERLKRIPIVEKQLKQAKADLEVALTTTDTKILESMITTNKPRGETATNEKQFREFDLGDGFIVYVGKNAANNDQLTMKFAKQNDWWFHARGSSGSHCVLRAPSPKDPIPKPILEAAAAIAAYYSGSRNATWTPVVYTQRKHVRKSKGANVGAVTLSREDVVMVKPGLPIARA